ncbi:DUF6460 domain-containing protein [Rhizobium sp. L1K21]|uniref:DUF6460 domain-containing protein n=1 Tax=Rhizobium sp. L1K21 TaxID=2954933 RepID=UPI002093E0A4|nr:DUF6460 domain-containing protein [Rhizobium sp. L1K21]MCO6187175.1 DUF6460 domain-containing protein [Rhizobium sp. L1K21]
MSEQVNKFLGDSPFRVLIKLIAVSIFVGFIMSAFGWYPMDIFWTIRDFFFDLWRQGFQALGAIGDYFLLGAAIVIPAFIIIRIMNYRR